MKNPQSYFFSLQSAYTPISSRCFLAKVDHIIYSHMDKDDFKIDCLCKKLFLSRMQLHRKLKRLCGLSASAYIRMIKFKRALDLLEHTDLNVSQIAYKLGFKDPSYFTRIFVKEFQCSPSQMRKNRINKIDFA